MMAEGLGVTPVYNLDGGHKDDSMFGGGGMWIFFLFFLLAWGGNGIGGFGGGSSNGMNQINNDFIYSNLSSQLRDSQLQNNSILNSIDRGICQLGYENLQNLNGIQSTLTQGFSGLQAEIASCLVA